MEILGKKKTVIVEEETVVKGLSKAEGMEKIAPKDMGRLDMVIAFDTTGSMASYIDAVRKEVSELIPRLFKDNEDLRLGIVAFGDYCDMTSADEFGKAYQCIMPTADENGLVKFIRDSRDTSGGDGDEFYELVLKKIVEETPWREGSTRSILLIADAEPHPLGYSYEDIVENNSIDWRDVARKAASMKIKIDTVTITDAPWYKTLSAMTNGVSVPFSSGYKTSRLVEASVMSRGSALQREKWDRMYEECEDEEMKAVFASYKRERDSLDDPFNLDRFIKAQDRHASYRRAMEEMRRGRKDSHWMWYVFPQMKGLGHSPMAVEFGIRSLDEARAYMDNRVLSQRLRDAVKAMAAHAGSLTPEEVLGGLDAMKLRSCLTLFDVVCPDDVFAEALTYLYEGKKCQRTLEIIGR